ncbi:MAG: hypothetical protein SGI86_08080 [Deltaproteobacteria bacterium]|nr:hypothetical protein [Deltaproteobacteria bacterium]
MAPSVKPRGSILGKVLVFLAVGAGLISTVAYLHRAKHQILQRNAAQAAKANVDSPHAGLVVETTARDADTD